MATKRSFQVAFASINDILPIEVVLMILKKLGFKSIRHAKLTCKNWRDLIVDFNLVVTARCKLLYPFYIY